MKKSIIYSVMLLAGVWGFTGCSEDDLDPNSIFVDPEQSEEELDRWLYENYTKPYNIQFIWRMNDQLNDNTFNLVPARYAEAVKLSKLVKFLWCDSYDELMGQEFLSEYAPRVFYLVGTAGFEDDQMRLGTAEGGLMITLYVTNWLDENDIEKLNEYYFKTMHHEFAHILHQTIDYPQEFNLITSGDYTPNGWFNRSNEEANVLGFVSNYASSEPREDFVETIANYIVKTTADWELILKNAGDNAPKIEQKLAICRRYMKDTWELDLDKLREIVQRRQDQIPSLDLEHVY